MFVYIESVANPSVRFLVVDFDLASGIGKIKGGYGTIITRNISKPELLKRGYRVVKSEKELPMTPRPAPAPAEG